MGLLSVAASAALRGAQVEVYRGGATRSAAGVAAGRAVATAAAARRRPVPATAGPAGGTVPGERRGGGGVAAEGGRGEGAHVRPRQGVRDKNPDQQRRQREFLEKENDEPVLLSKAVCAF